MTSLGLDGEKSTVRIRTFAEGLFSRLAHDLELVCRGLRGTATPNDDGSGTATLEVPVDAIDVAGTIKGGRVDSHVSPSDRREILAKMRHDVFRVGDGERAVVRVEATLSDAKRGQARVRVVPPAGRAVERTIDVRVDGDDRPHVTGTFPLSIRALGGATVKGPMNAFRMKDDVTVTFDVVFQPA